MGAVIDSFVGEHHWLSNFHACNVVLDCALYPSVENAYQAAKTTPDRREPFLTCTPGQAKRMGRGVPLRPDWDEDKVQVMRSLLAQKFRWGSQLATKLLATEGVTLIEGNHWGDRFWGVCDGVGRNELGQLLMMQRWRLQAFEKELAS